MSTGIIWLNKEDPNPTRKEPIRLWAVSDTLYSYNGNVSLDIGSKLFQIAINFYKNNPMTVSTPSLAYKIGYCFAGSTQAGLNTFALLNSILNTLRIVNDELPSLEQIADACHRIALHNRTPIINNFAFEYAIFGFCLVHKKYECFHIKYAKQGDPILETIMLESDYLLIGSHCEEIRTMIEKVKDENPIDSLKYNRAPAYIANEIINQHNFPDIGGSLQLGIAQELNFELYAVVSTNRSNKELYFKIYNIDIYRDIISVGPCFIEPHALILD